MVCSRRGKPASETVISGLGTIRLKYALLAKVCHAAKTCPLGVIENKILNGGENVTYSKYLYAEIKNKYFL